MEYFDHTGNPVMLPVLFTAESESTLPPGKVCDRTVRKVISMRRRSENHGHRPLPVGLEGTSPAHTSKMFQRYADLYFSRFTWISSSLI